MAFFIDDAKCTAETAKAICVEAPDFDEPQWIPQSQVDEDSEVYKRGPEGRLAVSDWWAHKQGWE